MKTREILEMLSEDDESMAVWTPEQQVAYLEELDLNLERLIIVIEKFLRRELKSYPNTKTELALLRLEKLTDTFFTQWDSDVHSLKTAFEIRRKNEN